ncbi:iron-containing alcohol dehydrogenase [Vibrio rarus]|uniref:iron-containing alcohol dehydrogenase n=1 Tax=Vibrio rarus TaxID=413403 RepID=UPI0021C29130|nr:iron-containing alcohol dehydrogenase [Vibrio rarus]
MLHAILVNVRKPFLKALPIPIPKLIVGYTAAKQVGELCREFHIECPLLVTDKTLTSLGIVEPILCTLQRDDLAYHLFDDIEPDPKFETVRRGVQQFIRHQCDGIIALGGGSVIDCAKAISASAKTNKDIRNILGLFRVHRPIYPIIAIPTTAGTGSEVTVASVISDVSARKKRAITDPFIVPKAAVLDATLMVGLPPTLTAETGADALTHAIESYLSGYANQDTRRYSIRAIERVFKWLPIAVEDGDNLLARQEMALASYEAGFAFTRTYIGYVHAIAHQLGAFYHIPHGRANGIVLPSVLRFTALGNMRVIAQLASESGLVAQDTDKIMGYEFIAMVEQLLLQIAIPQQVDELKGGDIPHIAKQAMKEAFAEYPVPVEMSCEQCQDILKTLLKESTNDE